MLSSLRRARLLLLCSWNSGFSTNSIGSRKVSKSVIPDYKMVESVSVAEALVQRRRFVPSALAPCWKAVSRICNDYG